MKGGRKKGEGMLIYLRKNKGIPSFSSVCCYSGLTEETPK